MSKVRQPAAAAFGLAALAALGLTGCAENAPVPDQAALHQDLAQHDVALNAAAAQAMISAFRRENGAGAVTLDPDLMRLAGEQARAMAAHDRMAHDVEQPFAERIRNSPFRGSVAVENIAAGDHTLAEALASWRASPPHRANMLNRAVSRMGIAAVYAPASTYKVYWDLILAGSGARRAKPYRWGPPPPAM